MAKEPWYSIVKEKQALYFPTLKFQNEKYVTLKHKFSSRKDETYYWLVHPHHIEFRRNVKIAIYCSFDFSPFPFDSHECDLLYGMNFFSWPYARMVPGTVVHKKKKTNLEEPPLIGGYIIIKWIFQRLGSKVGWKIKRQWNLLRLVKCNVLPFIIGYLPNLILGGIGGLWSWS